MQHQAGQQQPGSVSCIRAALRRGIKPALLVSVLLPMSLGAAKLFEVCLQHFYIYQTIRLTVTEPGLHTQSASQLKQDIVARLRLQGIDTLHAEQIEISRHDTLTQIHIQYSVALSLVGNHIMTLEFDETFP